MIRSIVVMVMCLWLSACGQTGKLYMPTADNANSQDTQQAE